MPPYTTPKGSPCQIPKSIFSDRLVRQVESVTSVSVIKGLDSMCMKRYTICSVPVKASNEHFAIGFRRQLNIELFRVEQSEREAM